MLCAPEGGGSQWGNCCEAEGQSRLRCWPSPFQDREQRGALPPWPTQQQASCFAGMGRAAPSPHVPGFGGTSFSAKAELKFPVGWVRRECSWAHSPPCGGQKRESPPSSRCLEAGPPLWSRAREPPPPGTKPGPQRLKSGFTSCFSQSPGASHQLTPHIFCPCQPARIDQGTRGVSTLPSPNKGGLASAKRASPLGGGCRQVQKANCRHYDELLKLPFCF